MDVASRAQGVISLSLSLELWMGSLDWDLQSSLTACGRIALASRAQGVIALSLSQEFRLGGRICARIARARGYFSLSVSIILDGVSRLGSAVLPDGLGISLRGLKGECRALCL